ncbi:protein of unknown function [Moritella yayanosii]|uniref:Uncharacterized protein n=1 Tax=Moritella yayanosii TaxID=69539 RepID=A0A330LSL5_9GAMM|nr:protein of unknown function [Moritella yayanosii]
MLTCLDRECIYKNKTINNVLSNSMETSYDFRTQGSKAYSHCG